MALTPEPLGVEASTVFDVRRDLLTELVLTPAMLLPATEKDISDSVPTSVSQEKKHTQKEIKIEENIKEIKNNHTSMRTDPYQNQGHDIKTMMKASAQNGNVDN